MEHDTGIYGGNFVSRKRVYIYGAGNEYRKFSAYVKETQINVEILAIITTTDIGMRVLDGYPVIRPSEMDEERMDYVVVAVCKHDEIIQTLAARGIKKEKILFSWMFYQSDFSLKLYSCLQPLLPDSITWMGNQNFMSRLKQILRGYEIAVEMISKWGGEETHFVISNEHVGDAAVSLPMVKAYKEYHNNGEEYHTHKKSVSYYKKERIKKIVVVTNHLLAGVTRLLDEIDEVVVLKGNDLNALQAYVTSAFCTDKIWTVYPGSHQEIIRLQMFGITALEWMWAVPKEYKPERLHITEKCKAATEEMLNSLAIVPEKTVILFPHAQTTTVLAAEAWKPVVEEYQKRGFRVFTNVGPKEKELEATERLQVSLDVMAGLVDAGCLAIGVQSGAMDLLLWTEMKKRLVIILNVKNRIDRVIGHKGRGYDGIVSEENNVVHMLFENERDDVVINTLQSVLFRK